MQNNSQGTAPKTTIFSGVKPTGVPTLGNYLGAMKHFGTLGDDPDVLALYCVVDLHAITIRVPPAELRENTLTLLAQYIACGMNPQKCVLFLQSHVPAHAELTWVLDCYTMFGEMSRMTQFKDKSAKTPQNINVGLFNYPVLMAADVLLYQADIVPVGEDQKQHMEVARDIAERFNSVYGDIFTIPAPQMPKLGARIMSLQDPSRKMDKSDENENAYISLLDEPDVIMKKCKRAVTDSEGGVYESADKPGVSNLMTIYAQGAGMTMAQVTEHFAGKGYGDFKREVGELVVELLTPIREETARLLADKEYLYGVLRDGAAKAADLATPTLRKVYEAVGFIPQGG
ncbi:MAG: tryptophan--tRNA ligase [Oscillospiraceae bacterium]|nr:tryptophan--tRNA ligase [Oscillospiraceae bacterium]